MADPVRTKIREAIKYGLGRIATENGYYYTVQDVGDPPKSPEQFKDYPAVNLDCGLEDCANWQPGNHLQTGGNEALLHNSFTLTLDFYLQEANDTAYAQEKMLADVQKYFGNNYYIPDSENNHTVFNTIYKGSDQWGLQTKRPNCGITVEFMVWYRQYLTDPTQLG